jgi:hypothetical protein|tara:strand:+ start:119 stop:592 length:474 start_codon:yes stop_codon:yes gene_type:complete
MSIVNKLKKLNLEADAIVGLSYSDGVDVFVHNETEVDTALSETDVVSTFSELIATPGLRASTRFGGDVIQSMRDDGFLEDYDRNGDFPSFLAETISDNFYDQGFIEYSTEKYDHKRGFCTLSVDLEIPFENFMKTQPLVSGWMVSVDTPDGTLTFDA